MLTTTGRTGRGAGMIAAIAIAAVAIAGLAAAPDADVAPWAAHAQSSPTTVQVGALVANATGSDFRDDNRTAVIERAVRLFNGMYGDIDLDLSVTEFARSETVNMEEPGALLDAYNGGAGPSFYIGPTTSEGLTHIRDNATTMALLDDDNVLLVSPSSEAESLAIDDNIFRLAFNVARQGDMLVDEMTSAGIKSYIVVARNDAWGQDVSTYVGKRAGQEGLASRGDPITFDINRTAAYWKQIQDQVESRAGSVPAGEDKIGVFFFGYGEDYSDMAAAANNSDAIRDNTAWFAPSSTGIGAPSPISNDTARDFSKAVGLTALSQDIADNDAKRAIDLHLFADGNRTATFYEYSAHDSVFVLGHAMRMAMAAEEDPNNVGMVKKYMAAAAMNYTGAALGEGLLLNGDGDLRAPDTFTVHTLNAMGEWSDGRSVGSTVTRVGALLAIDSGDYADNNARDALLRAAADYNNGTDRRPLVKLITYDITDPTNSSEYVALDVLTSAYDDGNGPLAYIGPSLSSNVKAVLDYAAGNNILLLGYASESEELSVPGDNLFRMAVSTDRHGKFMAEVMKDAGVQSVVTVVRGDTWGLSLNSSIAGALAANGLSLAGSAMFAPGNSDWDSTLTAVSAAIAAGDGMTGVAFVGLEGEQNSLAPAALGNSNVSGVPWFVTPSGFYSDLTAAGDFAKAVNLTAIVNDVADSAKKSALDGRVAGDLNFYDYAAYDSLFVLGNAIAAAVESGKANITADDLRPLVPAQADAYDGILGDIALNANGDLGSPDRFAVYQIDSTSGEWTKTGATKSTPVVRIGALLAIDHDVYSDDLARDALRQASADFNAMGDGDRPFYVSLTTYDITDPTNSSKYVELDVLTSAYDDGNGPSVYIGPSLSSNVKDVLDYAAEKNILLLGYASESEELSVPGDNLFRMAVSADRHGKFMAEVMKDAGVQSVVTVVRSDSWGMSLNSSIAGALASNDLSLAGSAMFAPGNSDWDSTLTDVSAAIAEDDGMTGVAFVGVKSEQDGLAAAASGNAAIRAVPWFVTPSGYYTDMSASTRDFARNVSLTAIVNDVADNAKKSALDEVVSGSPTFYEYAAYDSLFILGNAIGVAVESGKTTGIMADDLRPLVPAQADAYDGILGDIALNANGDLGSPDRFAVYQIDSTSGEWTKTGATKSTPVVRIGALLAIDNTDYADNNARDALRQASADFNAMGDGDRPFYVSLTTYDITNKTDPSKYMALDALTSAHDDGNGPSVYLGPSLSSNVELVLPYATANDLLLLAYASESESLSIAGDNLFRTAISTARHGHFMAEVMADAGVKSVVTVVRNDSWGRSLDASIVEALSTNGLRMAGAVKFAPATSNWTSTVDEITSAIAAGGGNAGVAFVGVRSEQDGLAAAASGSMEATGVPWFVTPSGYYTDMSASTRDFARAVDMTAIVLDVEDNAKKSALDSRVAGGLNFYDYAAYDGLFVLGNSIAAASAASDKAVSAVNATDLRPVIPAQADLYEGILGDIALNSKGDLRSPDRFAVWKVDSTSGMWMDTGVTKSTPVVDVGAIVILESDRFDDSPRLAAMRIAVDEYNTAAEDGGALYLNLRVVKTSLSPGSATTTSPVAHEAVMAASSGEDGMRYYVGPSTSGNSQRVLEYANANGLTLISPSSTAPSLATEGDALFRLVPNDSQQGKVLADIVHNQQGALLAALINQTGHEHVVMVVRNDTWGQGLDASTSGRLGVHEVDITRIVHEESDADWSQTAMDISAEIDRVRTATPNDPIAVLHIGFPGDFVSLAAQASDYPDMKTVPWFGTDGVAGTAPLVTNATARQFADDVNLTATKFDVVSNEKFDRLTAALESQGVAVRTTYEYSAYDSVFVLGRAIEAAISAEGDSYGPLDVRASVRAAAAEYEGALGDIELNKAGDLRTPNSYAAWTVEGDSWIKVETHPSTPVFDIGALLMLDNNPIYTDDREKAAMDVAVDDFNTDHELVGDFYISLAVQRISIAPNTTSPDPDALAGLMSAYANGSGPSLYIGPSTSGNSKRVLEYANANDIVLISHSSTAPDLAIPGDNLFRMVAPDSRQGGILADLISVERGVTDLVMAVRGDVWGRGVDESTTSGLGSGVAITRIPFGESEGDWSAVATSLGAAVDSASASAAAKPQGRAAVLFIGFDGDFNSVASQGSAVPSLSSVEWFGPDGVGNSPTVIANATSLEFAKRVNMTTVIFSVLDNEVNMRLDPNAVYGPSAYDSVRIMGDAVKRAYDDTGSVPPALDVKAEIPAAAAAYTGALGNVALDASGDLLSPNTYAIYMINAATNMWTLDRIHPMLCGISLASSTIEFGDVNIGQASSPVEQTVRNAGRVALSMVSITATPWTSGSGATVLDAGATEVDYDGAPSEWMQLSADAPTNIPVPSLAEPTTIMFRLDATGASSGNAGSAEQTVTYTVTCEGS